jgi:hypothetical protein
MKINFLTQDPTVFPFLPVPIPGKKVKKGPSDSRIVVMDRPEYPTAVPNKHGDFLYKPGEPQFDACEPYAVLKLGMALYSNILQRDLPFAFRGKLRILPHDGEGINAFYNREDQAVHFLSFSSPLLKRDLQMAESLDVGAHEENGHLLLDGLRPQYLNLELESQAFHEAFGDISAMILSMQFDEVIDKMLAETSGDLTRSNVVSRLAEEAGNVLQIISGHPKKNHNFLRDATFALQYNWKYKPPEKLESWSPKNEKLLGAEPHNFSRLFSGIWYEIFVSLYNQDPNKKINPKQAVKNARDVAAKLILRGVADFAPDTTARFEEIAKAMVKADEIEEGGKHVNLLMKIFQNRNLSVEEKNFRALPKIKLKTPIITRMQAKKFLAKNQKALGLDSEILLEPAEDFPQGCKRFMYRNKKGETFLVYHVTQDFRLHGSLYRELEGVEYKITGSLQLGFDKKGNLISMSKDLINEEKRGRIEENILQLLKNEHIKIFQGETLNPKNHENFLKKLSPHQKIPYFAYTNWKNGRLVLERVPIFSTK